MVMDFGMIDRQKYAKDRLKIKISQRQESEDRVRDKSLDKRPKRQRTRRDIDREWQDEYDNWSADITQG